MGSGSSKEKAPPQKRVVSVENEKKAPPGIKSQSETFKNNSNDNTMGREQPVQNNKQDWSQANKNNGVSKTNGKPNQMKTVQSFESDSSDEDDIDAVLEATKNEYNNKMRAQNRFQENNNEVNYPESYAQRLQRQQYKHEPEGIMRQKTIYRNPDEWDMDNVSIQRNFVYPKAPKNLNQAAQVYRNTFAVFLLSWLLK